MWRIYLFEQEVLASQEVFGQKQLVIELVSQPDSKPLSDYNVTEGKWTSYVATAVDEHGEGSSDQSFFPRQ